jgi:hypothetical protein
MPNQAADRHLTAFVEQVRAANNLVTEQQAASLYHVRDAALALLAFRQGERIVIDKSGDAKP